MIRPGNDDQATGLGAPSAPRIKSIDEWNRFHISVLTRTQRRIVQKGYFSGDEAPATRRTLLHLNYFYIDVASPNGQVGFARLTTFGKRIQAALVGSAAPTPDVDPASLG